MCDVRAAVRRKFGTFISAWRAGGARGAFGASSASVSNSFDFWSDRLLSTLHLRPPATYLAWRAIERSESVISVVVPIHDTPPDLLDACFGSVLAQSHTDWELCACDDGSTRPDTLARLATYRGSDQRIRIVRSEVSLGIAGATNLAAEQASGEFLALLDHDDELHPQALAEIAAAVTRDPLIDLLYTDEDKLEEDGSHSEPYFKPDWSPEHILSVMYVLHCLTIRKALFWKLGGMRTEYDGAQDYDLVLRVSASTGHVHHIPRVLYHWRKIRGSAAARVDAKPAALEAGRRALTTHAQALSPPASVEHGLLPGTFRFRRSLEGLPPVTLVILSSDPVVHVDGRGQLRVLPNFVESIVEKSTYSNARILVAHDGVLSTETAQALEDAGADSICFDDPLRPLHGFNFARKANFAVAQVDTEHFILLNDDLEVRSPGWIEALLEPLMEPRVAAVGGRLLYQNGRVQHAGLVLGLGGGAGHAFYGLPDDAVGYCGFTHIVRNYSAVTAAVFATRRDTYEEVGQFDEALAHDYNDVDFCLRALSLGYRIVYTPFAELTHFEGASMPRKVQDAAEVELFTQRWVERIENDPYYNPNLPRDRADFAS